VHGSLFQNSIGLSLKDLLMFSKRRSFLSSRSLVASSNWLLLREGYNLSACHGSILLSGQASFIFIG